MISLYCILRYHITLLMINLLTSFSERFLERKKGTPYLACNEERTLFTLHVYKNYNLWSCQKVCEALVYLLDNIFIGFGT